MPHYTLYRTDTGEIEGVVTCPASMRDLQTREGIEALDGNFEDPETCIDLKTLAVIPRPRMTYTLDKNVIEANGMDQATLAGLPLGTQVDVLLPENKGMVELTVEDGHIEFTATDSGDYDIRIKPPFPYLPAKETISAR